MDRTVAHGELGAAGVIGTNPLVVPRLRERFVVDAIVDVRDVVARRPGAMERIDLASSLVSAAPSTLRQPGGVRQTIGDVLGSNWWGIGQSSAYTNRLPNPNKHYDTRLKRQLTPGSLLPSGS